MDEIIELKWPLPLVIDLSEQFIRVIVGYFSFLQVIAIRSQVLLWNECSELGFLVIFVDIVHRVIETDVKQENAEFWSTEGVVGVIFVLFIVMALRHLESTGQYRTMLGQETQALADLVEALHDFFERDEPASVNVELRKEFHTGL